MKRILLLCIACAFATPTGAAEDYPNKPINLLVTSTAGGPADFVARWVADKLSPVLGQPVVVINRPGAGGNIAMQATAASPPDGYTLVVAGQGPFALNPHMYARPGYDALKDFAPITQIERGPLILAVHPSVPVNSVSDLIRLAKAKSGQLSYGSPGTGTPPHMVSELFSRAAGIDVLRVPYQGVPAAMVDLLAGRLTYTFGAIPVQLPQIRAGRIKAIAVTSAHRNALVPDIPTIAESLGPFEYQGWLGIAAPTQTPQSVIAKLNKAIVNLLRTVEAQDFFAKHGRETVGSSPNEFDAYIREEFARWAPIIRDAGIRAE